MQELDRVYRAQLKLLRTRHTRCDRFRMHVSAGFIARAGERLRVIQRARLVTKQSHVRTESVRGVWRARVVTRQPHAETDSAHGVRCARAAESSG